MPPSTATDAEILANEELEAHRRAKELEQHRVAPVSHGTNGSSPVLGRSLPHSVEVVEGLLAVILVDGVDVLDQCEKARLQPQMLFDPQHIIVYEALLKLRAEKKPIDTATLVEELKTARKLESVGGVRSIMEMSKAVPTTATATYYISKVKEYAVLRELIRASTMVAEDCYNFTGDLDGFIAEQELRLAPIFRERVSRAATYTVWTPEQFRNWTPPMELNLLGAGYLRRRQITTLIGPPGVGKSRLSLWLAVSHISGRAWCGLDAKGGALKWLMVGNENDPERQKRDLDWFYRSLTADEQRKVDAQLFLHVLDSHEDSHLTLADPAAYLRMVATLKVVKPDVLVCDPWGNMIESNENDNEEVRRTLKLLLRAVSEGSPDCAALIIHHARTGKTNTIEAGNNYSGGSLGRGSKVLVSQARCELALWPGDSDDASKLVLTCEKVNNAPKFEPVGLVFENGVYAMDGTFSLKGWRDDIEGKRSRRLFTVRDVVEIVRQGACKPKDIVAMAAEPPFGAVRSTVYERLKEACAKGYLSASKGEYSLPQMKLGLRDITAMAVRDDEPPLTNPRDPDDKL